MSRRLRRRARLAIIGSALSLMAPVVPAASATPPSVPGIDAPELAALGPAAAGVMQRTITLHDRLDPVASLVAGHEVHADRVLHLRIWYPARAIPGGIPVTYSATLTGEPGHPDAAFTVPGIAFADAPPRGDRHPVIVLSHGYNNDPVMLSWLGENLATKGYVVVAPEHRDLSITDRAKSPAALLTRPLDITGCITALRHGLLGDLVDTDRLGLIGYSFGGYGVLAASGARLDSRSPFVAMLPADLVSAYAGAGDRTSSLNATGVRAIVAISPAGGAPWSVWGADGRGLSGVRAPLLVIAGSADRTVGYERGPAAIFAAATHADRHLLVFQGAGHDIGTNPPPAEMQGSLWNLDWFADPIWRKDRINAIATHFITAFLDSKLKGVAASDAYFDVPSDISDNAGWQGDASAYAARSQGGPNPTWKGFLRDHQNGLILRHSLAQ